MAPRLPFLMACSLVVLACDTKPTAHSDASAAPSATTAGTAAATPSTAPSVGPSLKPTKEKEYKLTAADTLGTLPDKVGVAVGEKAPDFTLHDTDGGVVNLTRVLAKGPAMLVFYRGGWWPYCNFQVRKFSKQYKRFTDLGVQLMMVSVDEVDNAALVDKTYEVPFPLLSDSDTKVHDAYKVTHELTPQQAEKLKGKGLDVARWSARKHRKIAIPSMFLIGKDGLVKFAHADRDHRTRPKLDELLVKISEALPASDKPAAD